MDDSRELLITNGRVIDPANGLDEVTNIYVKEGIIQGIGKSSPSAARTIEAAGRIVCPGLIDVHVHFREPGDEEEETIASGSRAAVAGGFTSVVCMPNTTPTIQNETSVEFVHRMGRQTRKTHVYVMGAITKDRQGVELAEMGLMSEAGAVGFTDDGTGVQDPAMMKRALKYAGMFNKVVAQHCQDNSLAGSGVMNAGFNSSSLGLPGMDPLAEELMLWRDIELVRGTGTRYHAQHISTRGAVEIIRRAKKDGLPVTCEVTPHHLLLDDSMIKDYDTNFKMSPPLRSLDDIAALREAVKDGIIDALATDHAPHLLSEKELEFLIAPFGIASLEIALPLYAKALIDTGTLDWPQMLAMMTCRPAKIIGIDDMKGSLDPGKWADITIFDPEREFTVDVQKFRSKGKNCPYNGWRLKGVVTHTIVGGEMRYTAED
jgi:dihydroorotase